MTRQQAIDFLKNKPSAYAKMLGFDKLGSLHNAWIVDMLRGQDDKTLQASRGTYKTTCVSIALALIAILLPSKRTLFMRKTDSDIKEVLKQTQKILLDPHTQYFVQQIYNANLRLITASATEITTNLTNDVKGTAQLVGIGTGASLTGKHFDRIFTDDIVNVQDRVSKAERDRTKIIYQELQNIKNRGGRIFNTGTPWHQDDAFSIMPAPEKYDCYHPDIQKIIAASDLDAIRAKMSPSLFAANYELRFVASEDVIFAAPQTGADLSLVDQGTAHVDAAFYGEDWTAFTVAAIHDGKYYVFGKAWRRHIDDVMPDIVQLYQQLNCGKMYLERNADKGYVAKEMRRLGVRTVSYDERQNKYIKIVSHLKFAWSDVVFCEGTDDAYIAQICDYTENAEHDDCPDSLASLIRIMGAHLGRAEYKSIWE